MSVEVSPTLAGWVCQTTGNRAVQAALLGLIAFEDPGGDPRAKGDYTNDCRHFVEAARAPAGSWPTSFGLLQLHTDDGGCEPGLGNGHSHERLFDPLFNLSIGEQEIQGRLDRGSSLYDALSPWSTRDLAWPLIQQMLREGVTPGCTFGPCEGPDCNPPAPDSGYTGLVPLFLGALVLAGSVYALSRVSL